MNIILNDSKRGISPTCRKTVVSLFRYKGHFYLMLSVMLMIIVSVSNIAVIVAGMRNVNAW